MEHYDKLDIIRQLRDLVKKDPNKYDFNKLPQLENKINSMNDDQINRALLLGEFQGALVRNGLYDWDSKELQVIRDAIESTGLKIKEVKQMEREGAERDDYAFVVDDDIKVVWVNKMQPLFKSGIYNLLSIGLSFPATSFNTVEELGEAVVKGIAQMKE